MKSILKERNINQRDTHGKGSYNRPDQPLVGEHADFEYGKPVRPIVNSFKKLDNN